MASINELIHQWQKVLQIEANALEEKGSSKIIISNGMCLARTNHKATYWFRIASDLILPDGTPVKILFKSQKINGAVISIEGFDLIVQLEHFIGNEVNRAKLISAPWEWLRALSQRFDSIKENTLKKKRIYRVVSAKSQAKHSIEKIKNEVTELILRTTYNATTYLWGPPGTGKTYTLSRTAAYHYKKGKKILILAHSNQAVDVLSFELANFLKQKNWWQPGDVFRYGLSHHPELDHQKDLRLERWIISNQPGLAQALEHFEKKRKILKEQFTSNQGKQLVEVETRLKNIRMRLKEEEELYVKNAQVLAVTLSKAATDPLIYEQNFDLVIVDEASMAYVPQIAFAASLGKQIVVSGDFKQLPPIALAEHRLVEKWLRTDIFNVTKIVEAINNGQWHQNLLMVSCKIKCNDKK